MIPYILTDGGVSLAFEGKTVSVAASDSQYEKLIAAIVAQDDEAIETALTTKAEILQTAANVAFKHGFVTIRDGAVYYDGKIVDTTLTQRMLDMLDKGFDLKPMANFLMKLQLNPSYRAVNDLYTFLEKGRMPLTPNGRFLAYKAVRADFKDIHSGTFDNSIGQVVEMLRNQVDEDPNATCSAGLHVCSFEYLPNFAHADGHVVVVAVDPADVVSIPTDYNNSKMRVCRYEVIEEVEGWYTDRRNTLADTFVLGNNDFAGEEEAGEGEFRDGFDNEEDEDTPNYRYEVEYFIAGGDWEYDADFDEEYDATSAADALSKTYRAVRVVRRNDDAYDDDGITIYEVTAP